MTDRKERLTQTEQVEQQLHYVIEDYGYEISDEEVLKLAQLTEDDSLELFCKATVIDEDEGFAISDEELLELARPTFEEIAMQAYDDYDLELEEFYYNYEPYYCDEDEDPDCNARGGTYGAWK